MKQVECNAFGPEPWNNVLVVDRDPVPVGPGEIRVAVKARPINPADLLLLEGRHLFRPTLPAVVGIEGAGVIVEVGPGVTLTAGTLVAIPSGGTWREQVTMPAANAKRPVFGKSFSQTLGAVPHCPCRVPVRSTADMTLSRKNIGASGVGALAQSSKPCHVVCKAASSALASGDVARCASIAPRSAAGRRFSK